MANRIKMGDLVKIISGNNKGKIAKVTRILPAKNQVFLEGIGERNRHMKRSLYNPTGGKKKIQLPIAISKVALVVDEKSGQTTRVGYQKDDNGRKTRIAKQLNNKPIDKSQAIKKGATK